MTISNRSVRSLREIQDAGRRDRSLELRAPALTGLDGLWTASRS
jgi:hypothetical protein